MKRMPLIVVILVMVVFWAGCIRTTTYVQERADQQLEGNRGYVEGGTPPSVEGKRTSRGRTMTRIEIELPSYAGWARPKTEDKEIWGNRGIIGGGSRRKASFYPDVSSSEEPRPQPKRKYTK